MSERTELGRIQSIEFGFGGYQDAMIGVSVTLSGKGWGVGDFKGGWAGFIERNDRTQWTEADRSHEYDNAVRFVDGLLTAAKKKSLSDLKGVPVEVTFDGMALKSWRILTEVL